MTEFPLPKNAITNDYRKTRLLHKGCTKLLRLVDKHHVDIDKSIKDKTRLSQRLGSNMDRVKMSIMSTRANAVMTPNLAKNMEDSTMNSGCKTSKNAYVKHELISRTAGGARKSNYSGAPPNFPSMAIERSQGVNSEMQQSSELHNNKMAHVPKLLLTQALQF